MCCVFDLSLFSFFLLFEVFYVHFIFQAEIFVFSLSFVF